MRASKSKIAFAATVIVRNNEKALYYCCRNGIEGKAIAHESKDPLYVKLSLTTSGRCCYSHQFGKKNASFFRKRRRLEHISEFVFI